MGFVHVVTWFATVEVYKLDGGKEVRTVNVRQEEYTKALLRRGYKFIYWEHCSGLHGGSHLLVGDTQDELLEHAALAKAFLRNPNDRPVAMGKLSRGKVIDWGCAACGITTPDELKPVILEALGL
ncbi:MAG: hypothetical protein WCV84_04335 [Patescibacteria group bacterium]